MCALKLRVTLFELYTVFFCGEVIVSIGGFVSSAGDTQSVPIHCAFPKLTNFVAAMADIKTANRSVSTNAFLFIVSPFTFSKVDQQTCAANGYCGYRSSCDAYDRGP